MVDDAVREAQIEGLTSIVGAMLAVLEIESDAADLWPEAMRKGSPEEIRRVSAQLADTVSVSLFKRLRQSV
jgi:hypothetical protein